VDNNENYFVDHNGNTFFFSDLFANWVDYSDNTFVDHNGNLIFFADEIHNGVNNLLTIETSIVNQLIGIFNVLVDIETNLETLNNLIGEFVVSSDIEIEHQVENVLNRLRELNNIITKLEIVIDNILQRGSQVVNEIKISEEVETYYKKAKVVFERLYAKLREN
jgi:DNA repair ATPase RecN